ncbi:hypothetical protein ACO22_05907 [Paracoccidioides brasiliensis]|uniref:Uncharacterized protein n=1 Tax=Paracoccidioides brasiliensis TaxID=121759 RepID=A0A1D2J8Y2_PARBR|nr:hypothetical protein ACO22_05907 [Paracoccidioides brasiliensis]
MRKIWDPTEVDLFSPNKRNKPPPPSEGSPGKCLHKLTYQQLCASSGLAGGLIAVGVASAENGLGSKSTLVVSPLSQPITIDVGTIFLIEVAHRVVTFMQSTSMILIRFKHSYETRSKVKAVL